MSTSDRLRPGTVKATRRAIWDELSRHQTKVLRLGPDQRKVVLVIAMIAVQAGSATTYPLVIRGAVDAIFDENFVKAVRLAVAMIGMTIVWNLMAWFHRLLAAKVGHAMLGRLQDRVFRHVQLLPLDYFTETKSGEIQSKLTENFTVARYLFVDGTTGWVYCAATGLGGLMVLGLLDWRLLLVTVPMAVTVLWLAVVVGRRRARIADALRDANEEHSTVVGESVSPRIVIVNKTIDGRMQRERFGRQTSVVTRLTTRLDIGQQTLLAPVDVGFAFVLATVVVLLAVSARDGEPFLSAGGIVAFNGALAMVLYTVQQLVGHQLRLSGVLGRFEDAFELLRTPVPTVAGRHALPPETPGRLTFEEVSYQYKQDADLALDDVTFEVSPGEHVAIVGKSGAGKSTVSRCAARLLVPARGWVSIDGVDLLELDEDSLRRTVGLVSQDAALIHATVEDNIRWGRAATDEEVEEAARRAQIHDFIMGLPDGYETIVGQEGSKISGGERQRIHIARVALGQPTVLILDEATSALDPLTQSAVDEALREVQEGRTTLTIAHRTSTVLGADRILVFDAGRLVESGTHDELMRRRGHYAEQVVATLGTG